MSMSLFRLSPLRLKANCKHAPSRTYSGSPTYPPGFHFWPSYFSSEEQDVLLAASLYKLDNTEPRPFRRRRKDYWKSQLVHDSGFPHDLFAPDNMYDFQKGHFDGVIHDYREMHLSSWPVDEYPALAPVLERLYALCPDPPTKFQTHLLHLASYGEILPHVDNLEASGSWILGVSLGDARILRLNKKEGCDDPNDSFSLTLPSGCVYLQRDHLRYHYLHSIDKSTSNDRHTGQAQRLSIMIRDQYKDAVL
ncbi:hypothetical protein BDN70DRAFT_826693 [Pholiota conissans]|uniref:Alpha-ketoglutarate-dependent dioxygenase AlkB-like domain-containing protein n=1 Tax=Pholiota conissans TaxID=109636 RepID=A0A9P5ZDB7_9AGAR|nr:hypothetical protein BDN70DRAFT_826693 [Pholiota conissans]